MTAIMIVNLSKDQDIKAVNQLNLNIEEGELFALLGVNGALKTTTIKMLTGLIKPNDDEAFLMDKSILHNLDDVKEIISISPQETAITRNLTILENLDFIGILVNDK